MAREMLRFVRQRNRVIGAIGTPLLFWVLLGAGIGRSFRPPGLGGSMGFMEYFFPGTLLLVVLFTAIFASISVIEDRNAGFLQGVLVAPVPRLAIVLGKVLGGAGLGFGQGLLLVLLGPLAGLSYGIGQFLGAALVMALTAMALSAFGFLLAWRTDSVQGFHAVMNLLMVPMWLLSGAFFPASGAALWVRVVMAANPLSYSMAALRHVLYPPMVSEGLGDPPLWAALLVLLAFTGAALALAALQARRASG
ncbi:MAG: ABC transporter permease [Candidatus Lambdaproteobacteria bacterium]|nr:ABC transporter permease [Candidatus Lambdaproteobacteria bacterium]